MRRIGLLLMLVLLGLPTMAQDGVTLLKGRVSSGGKGVPYATLQLCGTSLGVSCNDVGEYELKVPLGHEADTVVIRSMGYTTAFRTVAELAKHPHVRLDAGQVELREVSVKSYRKASHLLKDAVARIDSNYHLRTAWPTFFYRDWRALDGELYLYDEAVMNVRRTGYARFADKRVYRFESGVRELEGNGRHLLRHRLLVFDRHQLELKLSDPDGIDMMTAYYDDESFFDPVATPQATYMLARRMMRYHKFEPIMEFMWDGELYYRIRSVGPGRLLNAKVHYEYLIRKRDLAIVRITSRSEPVGQLAPQEAWVNPYYTWLTFDTDTSAWEYGLRDGHYTLTHYYHYCHCHLGSRGRGHDGEYQHWWQGIDWTLTDFAFVPDTSAADELGVLPQTLLGAFGASDFNSAYWGRYNSIPIDTLPLRLLEEKYRKNETE